jgi:DNA primase
VTALIYPPAFLDELRSTLSIVGELERRGIAVTPLGFDDYEADCPYCHKRTFVALYMRNKGHQQYWCKGCHSTGELIGLTMRLEKCGFDDAVTMLAERAEIPVRREPSKFLRFVA